MLEETPILIPTPTHLGQKRKKKMATVATFPHHQFLPPTGSAATATASNEFRLATPNLPTFISDDGTDTSGADATERSAATRTAFHYQLWWLEGAAAPRAGGKAMVPIPFTGSSEAIVVVLERQARDRWVVELCGRLTSAAAAVFRGPAGDRGLEFNICSPAR
jgi:hypothetical protein